MIRAGRGGAPVFPFLPEHASVRMGPCRGSASVFAAGSVVSMDRTDWNPFFRFPLGSLGLAVLVLAPLWVASGGFRIATDPAGLLESDLHKEASYGQAEAYLPEDGEILLVNLRSDDVFTNRILELMREIGEAFLERPGVGGVKSLTHSYLPLREGASLEFRPLVPRRVLSDRELASLRRFALDHPLVRNVMVSEDGASALITVEYEREFPDRESRRSLRREVESVLAGFASEDVAFQVLAPALVREELEATLRSDLTVFLPAAAGLLLVLFRAVFPLWRILLFIALVAGLYLSVLPGLFGLTGLGVGPFAVALFPLLGGIQLTLLAHLASAFQDALRETGDPKEAIARALGRIVRSCVFAALTTAAGLLALVACDVEALRVFGLLGALGVAAGFVLVFGPGVAVLRLLFANREGAGRPAARARRAVAWQEKASLRLSAWVGRKRRLLPALGIAGCAACLPGLVLLETDTRISRLLDPESPTRRMVEAFDRDYGGIHLLRLEFASGAPGGIDAPEYLRHLWSVQEYALARNGVSGAYSYALLFALLNQVWEGGDAAALAVPDSRTRIRLFAGLMRAQEEVFPLLGALSDEERSTAYVYVRTPELPSSTYLELVDDILEYAGAGMPEGGLVSATEGIHTILEAERRILRGQLASAGWSLAAIAVLLLLLWRSGRLALAGLLAAALPVAAVLGLAGYAGIPLNSVTIMMAAIVLGVTVDDVVHFVTYWRQARERAPETALAETFRVKGPPVTCTTGLLVAIFSLFATASFPPVVHFGSLAAAAFLFALASVLLALPSLLSRPRGSAGAGVKGRRASTRQRC